MSSPWQSQLKDLKSRSQHMLETKVLSDCTIAVSDGVFVEGHKVILSAASPVLHEKLTKAGGDHPKITVSDVEPDIFQLMLKYIYTDAIDVNEDTVCDLALAAKTYQLPFLLKGCCDYLTPKNVLQAYSLALHSTESDDLKKKCEEVNSFKATGTKTATATRQRQRRDSDSDAIATVTSFEEACLDVVVAVFSFDVLDIDSELDLLTAADRYAKHISKGKYDDGNSLSIRNVLEKIRFLTMTAEEFGKGRNSTSVLSDSDACAILSNIVYKDLTVPMPKGFSQTRDARKRELKIRCRVADIDNLLSENKEAFSEIMLWQNLKWRIYVCRRTENSVKYLGVFIKCNWDSGSSTWSCNAKVELTLLRVDKGTPLMKEYTHLFKRGKSNWGYPNFLEVSKVLDPNNHYIEDGAITIEALIKADKPQGL
ncbi:hypothetical protein ABMA27_005403 [Loxostege sticticalis]|uniref:Uncharacterized protein n=1 Tax=Loxostege sticticalis TaxID=481309 RepID=A0ABR3HJ09_LOXSC